jgi:hypothetical protein
MFWEFVPAVREACDVPLRALELRQALAARDGTDPARTALQPRIY